MKILLVEPDYVLMNVYSQALSEAGHQVVAKSSAQDAVDSLNVDYFDLIIIEIQMAGHNGVEFLHELRSYSEWQELPIILLTIVPRSSFGVQDEVLKKLGIKDYLYKPIVKNSDLIDSIDRLVLVK